jgi:hypothetical protein
VIPLALSGRKFMANPYSYSLFFDLIESYLPKGFLGINDDDPIMRKLNSLMEENDQFITVSNLAENDRSRSRSA